MNISLNEWLGKAYVEKIAAKIAKLKAIIKKIFKFWDYNDNQLSKIVNSRIKINY
ncbi:hypothetical protein EI74_0835 [Mycoplasma testudineum]|uniref:Uncharacterized protein n=1 Tax=Mycoplasma testudineum TaxID=244584 RepID=A0A4R6IDI0_9MOLU|nr:hypothetical protein EI74_0835 [Mycoplasma testudineum]